jgi:cysteine protease ATG4
MSVVVLGRQFGQSARAEFESALKDIPRFTYRKNFSALPNGSKSDWHWGCCIRSGQGLLAQYLHRVAQTHPEVVSGDVLSRFWDVPDADFGLHAFVREAEGLGVRAGEWVKPSCVAAIIVRLLELARLPAIVTDSGLISRSLIVAKLEQGVPVLLLVPMMLDPSYIPFVQLALSLPQSLGIVGGKRSKSFFLVGCCADEIFYFDPHSTIECVTSAAHHGRLFKPKVKHIGAAKLSSSMVIGLYITCLNDIEEILQLASPWKCPLGVVLHLQSEVAPEETEENGWIVVGPI